MNLIDLARLDDNQARQYFEGIRWPNGPVCPHCQCTNCTRLEGEAHRPGTLQCNNGDCRLQFTATVGTVLESSHLPIIKWLMAFHLICSSKKGFSAKQLQRELEIGSYRTAWFLLHRVRHAMTAGFEKLDGVVEADETYVGGKPRYKGQSPRGRGTKKAPVMALVQRDGDVRCFPVQMVDSVTLHNEIVAKVSSDATLITDELPSYKKVGKTFAGGHHTVCHREKEYVRKARGRDGMKITTNTVESFFALLKRGNYGVYHSMSKRHLHRYCEEFAFRWRHRKVSDSVRTECAIAAAEGKRLMYETSATR
ncbi:MAG: IS1595 family transposase [Planctomycetaceae bacterium]|nr:IS1595 family transposase [Planctomycetaceae bacterium]